MRIHYLLVIAILVISTNVAACPLVNDLIDYNCDQNQRFLIAGDSIVAGLRDTKGGYAKRLDRKLPRSIEVKTIGIVGIRTDQLLRRFLDGDYKKLSRKTDFVLIDLGRNDCRDNLPPLRAVRNIKRLVRYIRRNVGNSKTGAPFVVVATQIPDRERRRVCIEGINKILLSKKSMKLPVYLRFDKLPESILGPDKLHPDPKGYARMMKKLRRFINKSLQTRMSAERPDNDNDGIYDFFETARFETSTDTDDTDGDTLLDGEEVFTYSTDPLLKDSDGDSRDDNQEIDDETDPNTPD